MSINCVKSESTLICVMTVFFVPLKKNLKFKFLIQNAPVRVLFSGLSYKYSHILFFSVSKKDSTVY
jgi:hypothetical protein